MILTKEMTERAHRLNAQWNEIKGGYATMVAQGPISRLAYVALPPEHPACGQGYDEHDPDVSGGLTFANGNVFGWDYGHAFNRDDVEGDLRRAIDYFSRIGVSSTSAKGSKP